MRGGRWVALVLIGAATACVPRAPEQPPTDPGRSMAWQAVALDGSEIVTLTPGAEGSLLVGTRRADRAPEVLAVSATGAWTPVEVVPGSGYGQTARWMQISSGRAGVVAVGADRGGAHGNPRWSVWRGELDGEPARIREQEQTFETFGGWEAGGLVGVAQLGADPVVVGSWQGMAGFDIAVWRAHDARWVRDPTPSALSSDRHRLRSAVAVSATARRLVIAGDELDLDERTSHPTVWTSDAAAGPWRPRRLPADGRVRGLGCSPQHCVVVVSGSTVAVLDPEAPTGPVALPVPAPSDSATVPAPAVGDRSAWVALPEGTGTALYRIRSADAERVTAPEGMPVALAMSGRQLWIATTSRGATTLWRTEL